MIHLWAAANLTFPKSNSLDVEELHDLVRYWPDPQAQDARNLPGMPRSSGELTISAPAGAISASG